MEEIKANSKFKRAEAFLVGTWIRKDGTDLDEMVVNVSVNNGSITSIVQGVDDCKNNEYGFSVNDIKWQGAH